MTNIDDFFPSDYLKGDDFVAGPRTFTIAGITMKDVGDSVQKAVLHFVGETKGIILNKTNKNILKAIYGAQVEHWIGQPVEIWNDPTVQFKGQLTGGLRVRVPQQVTQPVQQPIQRAPVPPQVSVQPVPQPQVVSAAPLQPAPGQLGNGEDQQPAQPGATPATPGTDYNIQ